MESIHYGEEEKNVVHIKYDFEKNETQKIPSCPLCLIEALTSPHSPCPLPTMGGLCIELFCLLRAVWWESLVSTNNPLG